ncbi:MAG: hypothetical protein Q8N63_01560 [Nanoarchaeota archaeon]|nr:hypothetical protein [Nanoarchaeota archaeon]
MADKYIASFDIAHGVSSGLGFVDYDEATQKKLEIEADSDRIAFLRAYEHANSLAKNYLADTSGFKTVTLQSLKDSSGREIDQVGLLRASAPEGAPIDGLLKKSLPEGKLVIKRSCIEDILEMDLSESVST